MKLSAPPPPPPPPPGDGTPGANAPGSPDDPNTPNANAPAEQTPEAPPAPAPAEKPLQWPAWYSGIDGALVVLVLVFAFVAASFVARNSDVWLHLAAGKRLFAGEYTPGTDPFSYSGADRAWVNHSWLLDAFAYLLYGGAGKVLVIAKALALALAFGLLIAIRRPKFALWPWAAVACVAVLACAPQFTLRPLVASILFLSATMYLLFRMPHKPNSWRFPAAIGGLFWLWANCDPWFFVGPLALALLLLGDLIQKKVLNAPEGAAGTENDEPLGRLPDTVTLAKALGIGLLACMLNPHHVRVWELPFELVGAPGTGADPRVRQFLVAPYHEAYYSTNGPGYNVNGLAHVVLFVVGSALLGFGYARVRAAHIALWIGFAALGLLSVYTIPLFAVVAVPLVAAQLNAFSARVELKTWGDPRSRLLLLGSSLGRFVCVLAVCALCVLAYPGWVHPDPASPVYARRVTWGVEPEPSLVRAAEQFKQWRESGKLPADARGMIANTDLANYVAWFAPQEKVFVNTRFNHHRRELSDYLAVRKGLGLLPGDKDDQPNPTEALEVLKKVGAEYVAVSAGPADAPVMKVRVTEAAGALYRDWAAWAPWYTDGRTTVFGWRPAAKPTFAKLRLDPVVLAFGPGVERLPEFVLKQPLVALGWEEPFVRPAKAPPVGGDEALGWIRYKSSAAHRQRFRQEVAGPLIVAFPATTSLPWHRFATQIAVVHGAFPFPPIDPDAGSDGAAMQAAPFLALRAARLAIAKDPDHPEPYLALAQVLGDPDLPLSETERVLGMVTAYRQALARMPQPEAYRRGRFATSPVDVALRLSELYLSPRPGPPDPATRKQTMRFVGMPINLPPLGDLFGQAVLEDARGNLQRVPLLAFRQTGPPANTRLINPDVPLYLPLDVARETLKTARAYALAELADEPEEEVKKRLQPLDAYITEVETALVHAGEPYNREKKRGAPLPRLVESAILSGMAGEALKLLTEKVEDLEKEYKEYAPIAAVLRVSLELLIGRVEDAGDNLKQLSTPEWTAGFDRLGLGGRLQVLRYQKAVLAGEYKAAGELFETIDGKGIGRFDKLPPAGPQVPRDLIQAILAGRIPRRERSESQQEAAKVIGRLLAPPPMPLTPFTPLVRPLTTELWRSEWGGIEQLIRQQLAAQMQTEAEFFLRRGVLSLFEGDIPAAKERFKQARREPPAGWRLRAEHPPQALMYLQLIELAEKRAAAP